MALPNTVTKRSVIDVHLIPLSPISRVVFAHRWESRYLQKLMRWRVKYGRGLPCQDRWASECRSQAGLIGTCQLRQRDDCCQALAAIRLARFCVHSSSEKFRFRCYSELFLVLILLLSIICLNRLITYAKANNLEHNLERRETLNRKLDRKKEICSKVSDLSHEIITGNDKKGSIVKAHAEQVKLWNRWTYQKVRDVIGNLATLHELRPIPSEVKQHVTF